MFEYLTRRGRAHGYRIYFIGDDGHIKDRVKFICADDEAARAYARQLMDGHDVELWRDDHQLAVFQTLG